LKNLSRIIRLKENLIQRGKNKDKFEKNERERGKTPNQKEKKKSKNHFFSKKNASLFICTVNHHYIILSILVCLGN
jgi:hypothetical protein